MQSDLRPPKRVWETPGCPEDPRGTARADGGPRGARRGAAYSGSWASAAELTCISGAPSKTTRPPGHQSHLPRRAPALPSPSSRLLLLARHLRPAVHAPSPAGRPSVCPAGPGPSRGRARGPGVGWREAAAPRGWRGARCAQNARRGLYESSSAPRGRPGAAAAAATSAAGAGVEAGRAPQRGRGQGEAGGQRPRVLPGAPRLRGTGAARVRGLRALRDRDRDHDPPPPPSPPALSPAARSGSTPAPPRLRSAAAREERERRGARARGEEGTEGGREQASGGSRGGRRRRGRKTEGRGGSGVGELILSEKGGERGAPRPPPCPNGAAKLARGRAKGRVSRLGEWRGGGA